MGITVPAPDHRPINRAFLASAGFHALLALLIPAFVVAGSTAPIHPQVRQRQATAPQRAPSVHVATVPAAAQRRAPTITRVNRSDSSGALATAAVTRSGSAVAQTGANAPPVVQSTPAAAPAESPRQSVGGYMPLGAEQPVPVLDPSVRAALAALGVHVTLTIDVDENGRTKDVSFKPQLDPAIELRIRDLLNAASWDPATCGAGLSCEATATITL